MKGHYLRGGVVAIGVIVLGIWLLIPSAFSHGIIVGFLVTIGAIVGAMMVAGKFYARRRAGKELEPPPLPASVSWDFQMKLTDLDGAPVVFDPGAGTVVVLNFWATWCAPCIMELPALQRLREKTADLNIRFGFVTNEKADAVRKFLVKRPLDLPIYLLEGDRPECFRAKGIPATYVMEPSGLIALRHIGAAGWDAERVVAFVRGLTVRG